MTFDEFQVVIESMTVRRRIPVGQPSLYFASKLSEEIGILQGAVGDWETKSQDMDYIESAFFSGAAGILARLTMLLTEYGYSLDTIAKEALGQIPEYFGCREKPKAPVAKKAKKR